MSIEPDKVGGAVGSDNLNVGFAKDRNFVGPGNDLEPLIDDNVISTPNSELGSHNVVINDAAVEKSKGFVDVQVGFGTVDDLGNDFVESEKAMGGNVGKGGDESEVVMSDKDGSEVYVCEDGGRFSDPKEINLVVDLDTCVRKDKKDRKKNGGFCVNDLVWAKVRSHPWWPGQIFEPVDASDDSRKRFRSKSHLVAYFGDHTFAWNDEVNLKPFVPHFTKMVKQTNKESFRHAVDCVLDEVSRRVEFGLSCGCIKDDVYDRLKTQVIDNAGIRESSSKRECGDRFLTVSSFEPLKFLDYVKSLAQEPLFEVDRLEYVMAKGQMSALYRWKGCYHLAEFGSLIGHLSNEADSKNPIIEKEATCEMSDGEMISPQGKKEKHGTQTLKRKNMGGGSCHSSKKVKRVSDLMVKKGSKKEDNENEIEGNIVNMSSSYAPKRKTVRILIDEVNTEDCSPPSQVTETVPRDSKRSFSVGASILRVAGQLSQPSPLLKVGVPSHAKATKTKGSNKSSRSKTKGEPAEDSPNEILLVLHNAAVEPLRDHQLSVSATDFFSDFRNSVSSDCDLSQEKELVGMNDGSKYVERPAESEPEAVAQGCSSDNKSKEKAFDSEIMTRSECEDLGQINCSDKVVDVAVQKTISNDGNEISGDEDFAVLLETEGAALSSEPHTMPESVASESGQSDEKSVEDESPTALTLKFTDMDSIPSEAHLNKIFSQFGPLQESETEVLMKKNCARVVFKRRVDADAAFSSSGKFETFGPSLVCYQLNYAPSPRKSPSVEAKRRKKR